jgi:hypothetical protein
MLNLETKDWLLLIVTILGPILAVQAQKALEAIREKRHRKAYLFEQLMATRAARVSPEHVRALNMIDLVFYGERIFGFQKRSSKEQRVLDAWKEYHDHLGVKAEDEQIGLWVAQGDELFTNLLYAVSQDLGFKFDRVQLKRGSYSPVAHEQIEAEQTRLRKAALSFFSGKHPVQMNVVGFPFESNGAKKNEAKIDTIDQRPGRTHS